MEMHHHNSVWGMCLGFVAGFIKGIFLISTINFGDMLNALLLGGAGAVGGFIATAVVKWAFAKAKKTELQKLIAWIKRSKK